MLNPWIEAWELRDLILRGEVRPREAAEFFLRRIERLNPHVRRFHDGYSGARPRRRVARRAAYSTPIARPCRCTAFHIRSRISRGPKVSGPRWDRRTTRTSYRRSTPKSRFGPVTRAESCSARPPRRSSAGVLRQRVAYVRLRAIPGTSSIPRVVRAGAPPVLPRRDSVRWPRAATAVARFVSPRAVADSSASNRRAAASRSRRFSARLGADSRPPARLLDRFATLPCSSTFSPAPLSAILTARRHRLSRSVPRSASARGSCA